MLIKSDCLRVEDWHGYLKKKHSGNANVQQNLKTVVMRSCYSKCGPWTSSTGITWELVRDAGTGPHASPTESESAREADLHAVCT